MSLIKLALKRPVSMVIGIGALVVFGIMSFLSFPLELNPPMEMPMMVVSTIYPGANPTDVEELVTKEIEDSVGTLSGIKTITSTSSENSSLVLLQYEYGTDMDQAYSDLKANLDSRISSLPEDVTAPTIIEMDMNAQDAMTLSVSGEGEENLLQIVEDEILPELEKLSSVATVSVYGGREEYIRVELLPEQLQQYGLDMNTIANAISAANFTLPAGSADLGDQSLSVTAGMEYNTTESLKSIPIPLGNGNLIYLSDVANIYDAQKDADSISRYNGQTNISIGIQRMQNTSAVDMSGDVRDVIDELNARGIADITMVADDSDTILSSLQSVGVTLILAILISMVVLLVFFGDIKASIIVGSSMPISLLATFLMMKAMGFSLNIITMGGLVIGVGMMVDNSIVVLESCFQLRREQKNLSFKEAALAGAKAVSSSILASTITTCVVFLPIALTAGLSGQMFKPLGFTIVFALTASLVSALMVVPLTFAVYKPKEKINLVTNRFMAKIEDRYANFLSRILNRKKTVMAVALGLVAASFALVPFIKIELIPPIDEGTISITVETEPGLQLEKVDQILSGVENMVSQHPDVDRYILTAGISQSGLSGGSSSSATIMAYLKDSRAMSTSDVLAQWQQESADFVDCDISLESTNSMSAMVSSSENGIVELNLAADNLDDLEQAVAQVEEMIASQEGIWKTSSSMDTGRPIAKVEIDPVQAAAKGFTPLQVASSIYSAISGTEAMTLTQDGKEYSVMVEYPEGMYDSVGDVSGLSLISPMGTSVPLTEIATITFQESPQSISRKDGLYNATVTGQMMGNDKTSQVQNAVNEQFTQLNLPEGVTTATSFTDDMIYEEFVSLGSSLLIAILLVFMVMAMQFESIRFSLMVMTCVPFSLVGSFLLLYIGNSSLSMTSMVGFLMLIGTVVNNGILYVDTANQYKKDMPLHDALVLAGKTRLRPILMTTLTTVLSMIPTALAIGEGSESMQGMAITVIGGLSASTILALLLLPTFYLIIQGKGKRRKKKPDKNEPLLEDQNDSPTEEQPPALPHSSDKQDPQ